MGHFYPTSINAPRSFYTTELVGLHGVVLGRVVAIKWD